MVGSFRSRTLVLTIEISRCKRICEVELEREVLGREFSCIKYIYIYFLSLKREQKYIIFIVET